MLSISYTVKEKSPVSREFFLKAKNDVLNRKYGLELIFIGEKKARFLNKKYRKKNYTPDILSFEIEKDLGEIYINLKEARKKSSDFDMSYENYLKFLFIHGLCHLKGMKHGSRMDSHVSFYISRN